jgi:hypothetical protein
MTESAASWPFNAPAESAIAAGDTVALAGPFVGLCCNASVTIGAGMALTSTAASFFRHDM